MNFGSGLEELTELYKAYNKKNDKTEGYRIQIMFSNDKAEAYGNKVKIYKEFPDEKCYVDYEQPYYKVKIGDFANRFEAYYQLQKMLIVYPGAFIVRDKISIKK